MRFMKIICIRFFVLLKYYYYYLKSLSKYIIKYYKFELIIIL